MTFLVAFAFLLAAVQAFQTLSHGNVLENVAKEQAFRSRIVEDYRKQNALVKEPTPTMPTFVSNTLMEQKRRQQLVEEYQSNLLTDQSANTSQVSNNAPEPPKPAFAPKVPEDIIPTNPASQIEQRVFVYSPQFALGLRHKVLLLAQLASRTAKQLASTTMLN